MSRKDYRAIADCVRELRNSSPLPDGWERIAQELAKVLKKDNPRFDYGRFWDYIDR